jgi:hypothetical protein
MAAWLPVIKATLPYVTQIVTAAIPAFTPKPGGENRDEVVAKQIAELQTAVTHNAESLKALALQLKETIEGIEAGAASLQTELARQRRMTAAAVVTAAICALVTIGVLVSQ